MTCHDAREQFSALVDEALGADARAALDTHLAGCPECRRELEAIRRTVALVRGIEPARAPAGFVDRVLAAARPEPWPRRLARRLFMPWPVKVPLEAAALIIVGVLAVWLFQRMPEPPQMARIEAPAPPAAPAPDVQAPRVPQAPAPAPSVAEAPPAPPVAASRPFDKRESDDAAKPPSPAEEARGQTAREGVRDQPAAAAPERYQGFGQRQPETDARPRNEARAPAGAEAKRSQIQSTKSELDKSAASSQVQGLIGPPPPPSQVAGRLAASDHERAERDLQALVARHGGALVWRRGDGRITLLDAEIPREAYARFTADVARLGRWTLEREARELPETVRVQIQIE